MTTTSTPDTPSWRPAWHAQAACRGEGTERWFPARGDRPNAATAICVDCRVRVECLTYALAEAVVGGGGGLSHQARRRARAAGLTATEALARHELDNDHQADELAAPAA